MKIFAMILGLVLTVSSNVFAQSQAQLDVYNSTKDAYNKCGCDMDAAQGLKTNALSLKSQLPLAPAYWSQEQKDYYGALIISGDNSVSGGNTSFSDGMLEYNTAVPYYNTGMTLWNAYPKVYATAVSWFQQALPHLQNADYWFLDACQNYNGAVNYYNEAYNYLQSHLGGPPMP